MKGSSIISNNRYPKRKDGKYVENKFLIATPPAFYIFKTYRFPHYPSLPAAEACVALPCVIISDILPMGYVQMSHFINAMFLFKLI